MNSPTTIEARPEKIEIDLARTAIIVVDMQNAFVCRDGYFSILISDAASPIGLPFTQDATIFNIQSIFGRVTTSEKLLSAIRDIPSS